MASLVWLRNDLRIQDNPALAAACRGVGAVFPLYIHEQGPGPRPLGGAAQWWLHGSLAHLQETVGGALAFFQGSAVAVFERLLAQRDDLTDIMWNRRYDPQGAAVDAVVQDFLRQRGIRVHTFPGNVLLEPGTVRNGSGGPFQVFTPFWKACLKRMDWPPPLPAPPLHALALLNGGVSLEALQLLPTTPDWAGGFRSSWIPGEAQATASLNAFLEGASAGYATFRNHVDRLSTSRLSPHIRFGEISVRQIWHRVRAHSGAHDVFVSELGWREFAYDILHHNPHLVDRPLRSAFDDFPFADVDPRLWRAWTQGETGYPIVDAAMRQLYQTGWMPGRVRMIVASFLVKDLLYPWQKGEQWFWDTLVDADEASNGMNWQWVAGCGVDAAPYFRVFNPVLQAEKFDPQGLYVKRWIPELSPLPAALVHTPWKGAEAGMRASLYPPPILDHHQARDRALAAYHRQTAPPEDPGQASQPLLNF